MIEFLEIDRDDCMRMLVAASGGVGRVALSPSAAPPMIRPVNFAFDDRTQSVVFRSALGSKLREGLSSGTAAFEIDGTDPVERAGWSVIIVGEAKEVTEPAEIDQLEDFELKPWAPGVKTHWVRIRATSASGRRIVDRGKWVSRGLAPQTVAARPPRRSGVRRRWRPGWWPSSSVECTEFDAFASNKARTTRQG